MHSDPQHIVVTGATGFLGSRIVEALAEHSSYARVIAAGRTIEPERHVKHNKVVYQLGELTDLDYCRQIVKGCSHIVNCASLSSPWGKYDEFFKANVLTNTNLIVACKGTRADQAHRGSASTAAHRAAGWRHTCRSAGCRGW